MNLKGIYSTIVLLLLASCSSERKPFMIVGEHNYSDQKGISFGFQAAMGSVDFKKQENLNLQYNDYETIILEANIGAGMRFNRFAFGLSYLKEFTEYDKRTEPDNDGKTQSLESFHSLKDVGELWTSYTITINPDWSSHTVYLSYEPINKIIFSKGPILGDQKFNQSKTTIGYKAWLRPIGFRVAKFIGGFDTQKSKFTKNGYIVGLGVGFGRGDIFMDYVSENFENRLIMGSFKIGIGVWF